MLYHLLYPLKAYFSGFNLIRYITFRSAFAAVTSLCISLFLGPIVIRWLQKRQALETINNVHEGLYEKHKDKKNVPTMGGVFILLSIIISVFLWADLTNVYIRTGLLTLVWLGVLGFVDDYIKCIAKKSKGIKIKTKLMIQFILSVLIYFCLFQDPASHYIIMPFFKSVTLYLGIGYFILILLVIMGTCNAVNLTDGLDGLAIGSILVATGTYGIMAYISGHSGFSAYLNLPHIPGTGELAIFCTSIMGACLGFLWFNSFPAQVFMGDTGALALGGIIGIIAVMIKQELLLVVVGGVFVIEALSVIIQVIYFKTTGKRFFLIAPIHHHFEMKGMKEPKIVVRFWILAIIFAVLSLCTLKIR